MSGRLTVEIDKVLVDRFTSWQGPVGRSVSRLASRTVKEQKALAPKRSGKLAASIRFTRGISSKGITFTSGSTLKYAGWMEHGTRPHVIRPKRPGGLLVFFWPKAGRTVFLRSVNHPGTRPYHYLSRGYTRALTIWQSTG
jgi:hypothetical protein